MAGDKREAVLRDIGLALEMAAMVRSRERPPPVHSLLAAAEAANTAGSFCQTQVLSPAPAMRL